MQIAACRSYHARTVQTALLRLDDGSAFKVYWLDIIGRDTPERYEWARGPLSPEAFAAQLHAAQPSGVGFITAFPHITKVFRFSPSMETVLHVRACNTPDLSPLDLARHDEMEFACYAEAAIAADEYHAWARAATVEEYLDYRSPFSDGPIARHAKLAAYFDAR